MPTSKSTFQKRQKEMKRQEKQRMKAERRAQKKLEGPSAEEPLLEPLTGPLIDPEGLFFGSRTGELSGFFHFAYFAVPFEFDRVM